MAIDRPPPRAINRSSSATHTQAAHPPRAPRRKHLPCSASRRQHLVMLIMRDCTTARARTHALPASDHRTVPLRRGHRCPNENYNPRASLSRRSAIAIVKPRPRPLRCKAKSSPPSARQSRPCHRCDHRGECTSTTSANTRRTSCTPTPNALIPSLRGKTTPRHHRRRR